MTSSDWQIVAVIVFFSIVLGVVLGIGVRHVAKLIVAFMLAIALIFVCTLWYRFGGPTTWPWQGSVALDITVFGPLLFSIMLPLVAAAWFARRAMRRKVI